MSIYVLIWIDRNKSAYVSDKIPELVQRKHPIMTYLLTEGQPRPALLGTGCRDYHRVSPDHNLRTHGTHPHLNHHHLSLTIRLRRADKNMRDPQH